MKNKSPSTGGFAQYAKTDESAKAFLTQRHNDSKAQRVESLDRMGRKLCAPTTIKCLECLGILSIIFDVISVEAIYAPIDD